MAEFHTDLFHALPHRSDATELLHHTQEAVIEPRVLLADATTVLGRGGRNVRTAAAIRVLLLYSLLVIVGFVGAIHFGGLRPIMPLLSVSPLVVLILYYDLFSSSRELLPELIAPVALSSVVAGMALACGLWRRSRGQR